MKILFPEFRDIDSRRSLTQLFTGDMKQVNIYHAKKGSYLGNHYHKETNEMFYVIKGSFVLRHKDAGMDLQKEQIFNKGQIFLIRPYETHEVECLTNTTFLTFLDFPYDQNNPDIHKEGL